MIEEKKLTAEDFSNNVKGEYYSPLHSVFQSFV